jgi:hypothetical protein
VHDQQRPPAQENPALRETSIIRSNQVLTSTPLGVGLGASAVGARISLRLQT